MRRRWYEDADEVVVALDQWLLADRPRDVLRLLSASHGRLYDSGREATVRRTIAAIPAAVAVSDLESMVDYAWCHLLVDRRRFVELVEQLTWWVDRSSPNEHRPRPAGRVAGRRGRRQWTLGRERCAESTGDARTG